MNRFYIAILLAVLSWGSALAQDIVKLEYFIDTDPGYGSATDVPITAGPDISNFSFSVPVDAVDDGFHTLFIRSKDVDNKWSLVQSRPFVKHTAILPDAVDVTLIECFIDTDPGFGNGAAIAFEAGPAITNLSFVVPVDTLADGFHRLFVRSRDANNKWSIVQVRPFVNVNVVPPGAADLTRIEYFIDTDPGTGNGVTVDFQQGSTVSDLSFSVSLESVPDGFHTLFVRSQDVNSHWSILQYRPFVKLGIPAAASSEINLVEYFVDTDPGYGNGISVPVTPALSIPDLSFQVDMTSLDEGPHKLFVRSKDADGRWSLVYTGDFSVCGGAAPVASAASGITTTGFTANWTAVDGATEYRLDVSADDFATFVTGFSDKQVTGATNFEVTGLTSDTNFKYRVRAVGATCTSVNSNVIEVGTLPAPPLAPAAIAATDVAEDGFTANWQSAVGATGYLVDVSADNFATFLLDYEGKEVVNLSEPVTGLVAATEYKYRVRAKNVTGISPYSNIVTVTTAPPSAPPAVPSAIAATLVGQTAFTANWDAVVGAASYRLDVSADDFVNYLPGYQDLMVSATSFEVTGLAAATEYKYRVRSYNLAGSSASSNEISVTTLLVPPPDAPVANPATELSASGFTANWNAVTGATEYRIDVSGDDFVNFVAGYQDKIVNGTSEIVIGLAATTAYKYRVRAVDANGTSDNSNVIDVTTLSPPDAPVAAEASTITGVMFTANWGSVTDATSYRLDVSADNFVSFVQGYNDKEVFTLSDEVTGLTAATSYQYRVRAVSSNGTSDNSNVIDVTTLPPPNAPLATQASGITTTAFSANWGSVDDAVSYRLDVSADNFVNFLPGYSDKEVSNLSEELAGLTPSTLYKYRVRSVNANGASVNSNVISVTTLSLPSAPTATAATGLSATGFTANWTPIAGATGYRLDVSADNFVNFIEGYNDKEVVNASNVVTGLAASTSYKYRVRTVNSNGISLNSNVVTVMTLVKQAQTITFEAIPSRTMGDAAFALTATATSGLAVTFTATTDHVTVAGSDATLVRAGKATITASQDGNDGFNAATPVAREFCINPAKPSITLGNANTESPLLTSNATTGNQWFKDGVAINGATGTTLQVGSEGVYTVQSTVETCTSVMSNDFPVIITGDIAALSDELVIAPNPADDVVVIQLPGEGKKEVQIYRSNGITTHTFTTQQHEEQLSVKHFSGGMYFVRVVTSTGSYFGRFIKK
jgi:hypothetical protein